MLVSEFDYHLPEELIAQQPLADRAASRLLHVGRNPDLLEDRQFREFPDLLRPDDLLVFNNTKVLPARLYGHRSGSRAQRVAGSNPAAREFLRGQVEVLLTKQLSASPMEWEALVHPGRKLGIGERVYFGREADESSHELAAEIVGRGTFGERHLRFDPVDDFFGVLGRIGHIPLPPYIDRPDTPEDREHYQTVYAKPPGSVAAPTAGLHFTPDILESDSPARNRNGRDHACMSAWGRFNRCEWKWWRSTSCIASGSRFRPTQPRRIQRARGAGRRIVAVGTTTVRTLEFAARPTQAKQLERGTRAVGALKCWRIRRSGEADIFIYPGFEFRMVGAMLTNFHLPKSTLLMLVSAFAGRERILQAYEHAVHERYRFYSYGDCMFVE